MSGSFTKEEARALQAIVNPVAKDHTDIVLRVPRVDENCGIASGVHVDFQDRKLLVSCHHVLKPEHDYFSCAQRLERDIVDDASPYRVSPLVLLDWSEELDLAVFDTTSVDLSHSKKRRYNLSNSGWLTFDRCRGDVGLAAFLYGLWGEKARRHVYEDGLVYLNAPIYTAIGPVTRIDPTLIIADMAEKELLYRNDAISAVRGTELTGGMRDLTGTSGSGLWIVAGKAPALFGLVLGRVDPCPPGTHLMRFTPVWALLDWLSRASLDRPRPTQ